MAREMLEACDKGAIACSGSVMSRLAELIDLSDALAQEAYDAACELGCEWVSGDRCTVKNVN